MISVFPGAQDVLVASVVGTLIQHPAATLHLNGVATAEIRAQVRTISAALIASALETLILEECNLDGRKQRQSLVNYHTNIARVSLNLQQSRHENVYMHYIVTA